MWLGGHRSAHHFFPVGYVVLGWMVDKTWHKMASKIAVGLGLVVSIVAACGKIETSLQMSSFALSLPIF